MTVVPARCRTTGWKPVIRLQCGANNCETSSYVVNASFVETGGAVLVRGRLFSHCEPAADAGGHGVDGILLGSRARRSTLLR